MQCHPARIMQTSAAEDQLPVDRCPNHTYLAVDGKARQINITICADLMGAKPWNMTTDHTDRLRVSPREIEWIVEIAIRKEQWAVYRRVTQVQCALDAGTCQSQAVQPADTWLRKPSDQFNQGVGMNGASGIPGPGKVWSVGFRIAGTQVDVRTGPDRVDQAALEITQAITGEHRAPSSRVPRGPDWLMGGSRSTSNVISHAFDDSSLCTSTWSGEPVSTSSFAGIQCAQGIVRHGPAAHRYQIFAITCPYSGNARLRWIRDTYPDDWADLVAFDREIRNGSPRAIAEGKPMRGQFFVHRSLLPLDQVDLDPPHPRRHLEVVGGAGEEDDPDGCSPWSCRSGQPDSAVERAA